MSGRKELIMSDKLDDLYEYDGMDEDISSAYDDTDDINDDVPYDAETEGNVEKKILGFFRRNWHFSLSDNNSYDKPDKKAKNVRQIIPDEDFRIQPAVSEDIFGCPDFPSGTVWRWQRIRTLGTVNNADRFSEEKRLKEFAEAANQLASGRKAFALACTGRSEGGAAFEIASEKDADPLHTEKLLRSAFGIVELESSPVRHSVSFTSQQAVCEPVRLDTETLDRMKLPLEPGRWADAAASAVSDTDCRLCLEFVPQSAPFLEATLQKAYNAYNELTHYLKDTRQMSANYGINGSEGKNAAPEDRIAGKARKKVRGYTPSYNASYGYSSSQSISKTVETRDYKAEQMQKRLRNRIRLLEQMLTQDNGWMIRITVTAPGSDPYAADAVRSAIGGALLKIGYGCKWESGYVSAARSSLLLPAYLLQPLISFPQHSFIGFASKPRPNLNLNPPVPKPDAYMLSKGMTADDISIPIGRLVWNGRESKQEVRLPKTEINRHMFVCGKTGSGKSNTVTSFLTGMQSLHYLVIEPVKGEYHSIPGIRRYNMVAGDKEHCLQMNPFWFPAGSSLQYHIDSLKLIISAAFDLYAAMPNILEQCLYRVYLNCGWDFVSGRNMYEGQIPEEQLFPTFRSLCNEIENYLENTTSFGDETKGDYEGALLSRLRSFTSGIKGLLLNTSRHIPVEEWTQQNIVVELDSLADDADKAIIMGALLIQYFQYVKYVQPHDSTHDLKHLFVLEEAHHLFKEKAPTASSSGKGSGGSSSTQLVEMLGNLLAEARAYGEGFIIVDQSPSNVSTAVLKNTGIKVVHRTDFGDDVAVLQKALLLDENDKAPAYLAVGRALIRYGEMPSPCEVQIDLCREKESAKMHPQTSELSAVENAYDRILSNQAIMADLRATASCFVLQILAEQDTDVIQEMFELFRIRTAQSIAFNCGIDSVNLLSDDDFYSPVIQVCVSDYVNELFPGQFCLSKTVIMFVTRIAKVLAYYRKLETADASEELSTEELFERISDNESFRKDWEILDNYRLNQIHSRMKTFYESDKDDFITRVWKLFYQDDEEAFSEIVPDIPIIKGALIDSEEEPFEYCAERSDDGYSFVFTEEGRAQFYEKLRGLVLVPDTDRRALWENSVLLFLNMVNADREDKNQAATE